MDNTKTDNLSESEKGVSNTTIAVLIILALVMTIIGTLAVISAGNTNSITTNVPSSTIGKVSFQILPNSQSIDQTTQSVVTNGTEQ